MKYLSLREQARALTPEIVAKAFEYAAESTQADALKTLSEEHPALNLTEYGFRKLLHEDEVFSGLYGQVEEEHLKLVRARFKPSGIKRKRRKPKHQLSVPVDRKARSQALLEALDGHIKWLDALEKCEKLGMNREFVEAWINLVQANDL